MEFKVKVVIHLLGIRSNINLFFSLLQENKYKEAVGFYEPIVKKHYDNVSVSSKQRKGPLKGAFCKSCPQHWFPLLTNSGAGQRRYLAT